MVETFTAHITPFGLDCNTFVYLPDGWQTSGKRYPVVYMFDGHNLFFDSTATYGTCWGLKEYMDATARPSSSRPSATTRATPGWKSTAPTTSPGRKTPSTAGARRIWTGWSTS